jgi:excisionase family DNA binding protein
MTDPHNEDRYHDAAGAANYLKVSLSWLRKKTAAGEIPHIKLGRRVVYDRRDLDEYMAARKKEQAWRTWERRGGEA